MHCSRLSACSGDTREALLHHRLISQSLLARLYDMKFNITIDRDGDGAWVTSCPAIPGCHSQGSTRQEAVANIGEAISLCLEVRAERGLPLTVGM